MSDVTTTPEYAATGQLDEVAERLQRAVLRLWARRRQCTIKDETGGLTTLQLSYLSTLIAQGPTRPSDLAGSLGVTPAATTVAVRRLARAGLVARSSRRSEQRGFHIEVTARGREEHRLSLARRESQIRSAIGQLSAQECEALRRALPILREVLVSGHEPQCAE